MSLSIEDIEDVKESGFCHEVALHWVRFMDGTSAQLPVAKIKAICSVCYTEFTKSVESIDLDEVE